MKEEICFALAAARTHLLGKKKYIADYLPLKNLLHVLSHQDGGRLNA